MMDCLFCGSKTFATYLDGVRSVYSRDAKYSIVSCKNCGLLQTYPRPGHDLLDSIYREDYAYEFHKANKIEKARRAINLIKQHKFPPEGAIIVELGCGSGEILKYLKEKRQCEVYGCEIDASMCESAREILGEDCISHVDVVEFLESSKLRPDYVYMSHSLEHFINPIRVIQGIRNISKPSTKVIVSVPNAINARRSLFPSKWGYWQVPLHVTHFSVESLEKIMNSQGFVLTSYSYANSDFLTFGSYILNVLNQGTKFTKVSALNRALISLAGMLYSFTYYFGRNQVSCEFRLKSES